MSTTLSGTTFFSKNLSVKNLVQFSNDSEKLLRFEKNFGWKFCVVTVIFDSFSICLIWKKWITLCQVMIFAFVPLNISFLLWIYRFLLLYVRIYLYRIKLINFHITFFDIRIDFRLWVYENFIFIPLQLEKTFISLAWKFHGICIIQYESLTFRWCVFLLYKWLN